MKFEKIKNIHDLKKGDLVFYVPCKSKEMITEIGPILENFEHFSTFCFKTKKFHEDDAFMRVHLYLKIV